jgi:predicted ABC-type transport system involved in lysophospholipase L1 biosynthesis ATPase subunit
VRDGNALEAAHAAHTYRSAAGQIMAIGLGERLQELEMAAGEGNVQRLRQLARAVHALHDAVMAELSAH